ncbi:MAG TPA: chemotaxis protein CheA [Polyangiaceae bacterium]|nr:chemotaxis protein CheA [Polyangiaceae bacterium]
MSLLFAEEAAELLADFEQALLLLESLPDDTELLNRVFRCAHTLKGNSKILGFEIVALFTHELENLLDRLRKQELMVTQSVADTLLASLDVLKALVAEVAGGPAHDAKARELASMRIGALVAELQAELVPATPVAPLEFPPLEGDAATAPVALAPAHAPVAGDAAAAPAPPSPAPRSGPVHAEAPGVHPDRAQAESAALNRAQEQRAEQPSGGAAGGPAAPKPAEAAAASARERRAGAAEAESSSVRVPIDKLDRLINLTGEVVIAQSMIAQLVTDLTPERVSMLQEVVAQMDRHCRELQERMLNARMFPIKTVFARFNRMVRDLAAATGKSLVLETSGEETELDKTVIERISDPLTHLVRNAIDHGAELPEERRARGKPEQVRIRLAAYQRSGNIFIDVADDGRGLNRDKIRKKAVSAGLIADNAQLSDDQLDALIFHPGFSTADQVTEISGRGVGMDVVKRNVEALRGSISILSTPGEGTCFRVKLPLTMAILDGLGLRVGSEIYLVPLVSVVESLQPRASDVTNIANVGEVVEVRGEYLPLIRLHELFQLTPIYAAPHEGLVMVLDDGVQRVALQIDELLGQYQVVIKSLETNFQVIPGIAGATILGDGSVALILDTGHLTTLARSHAKHSGQARAAAGAQLSHGSNA